MTDLVNAVLDELLGTGITITQHAHHKRFNLHLIWTPAVLGDGWKFIDFLFVQPVLLDMAYPAPATVELWRRDGGILYREVVSGLEAPDPNRGSRFGRDPIFVAQTSDLEVRVVLTDPAERFTVPVLPLLFRPAPEEKAASNGGD